MESTYFRRGFGLKAEIEGQLTADYHSTVVEAFLSPHQEPGEEKDAPKRALPDPLKSTGSPVLRANRTGRGYEFVPVQDEVTFAARVRRDAVWPNEVVGHVRQVYDAWDWRTMRIL